VLESGWTVGAGNTVPLMRGFDPAGDGYNGSLCCNREVAIVSPLCVAIRRELMQANGTDPADWLDFCTGLQRRGFFHRVCATVQVPTDHSWRADRRIACAGENCDAYFNPHFDPIRAITVSAPRERPGRSGTWTPRSRSVWPTATLSCAAGASCPMPRDSRCG